MAISPILNLIGNAFSGALELTKLTKIGFKKFGFFLTKYEVDIKDAGEGQYNPQSKKPSFWDSIPLINQLSENNQLRAKKVGDFLLSPSFFHILGFISIGTLFFSPLGPVAAGIGASISLVILAGNFLYQSHKLKITTTRKESLKYLLSLKDQEKQLQKGIENGKITPEMQSFYEQNIASTKGEFIPETVNKNKFIKYIVSDAASNFLESAVILTSAVLAFNIPSAVFGGMSLIGNSIEKGAKSNAELKSQYELKCKITDLANKMQIPAKTNAKSLAKLHDTDLKHRAFHLTCEKFDRTSKGEKFDNQAFTQTYITILSEFKESAPVPKVSFWKCFGNNIVKGLSMHKGLQQHSPNLAKNYKETSKIESVTKVMRAKFVVSGTNFETHEKSEIKETNKNKAPYKATEKRSFTEELTKRRSSSPEGRHMG